MHLDCSAYKLFQLNWMQLFNSIDNVHLDLTLKKDKEVSERKVQLHYMTLEMSARSCLVRWADAC